MTRAECSLEIELKTPQPLQDFPLHTFSFSQFLFLSLSIHRVLLGFYFFPFFWIIYQFSFQIADMKLTVKTLKGSHFQISVHANDTVSILSPTPSLSLCLFLIYFFLWYLEFNERDKDAMSSFQISVCSL